MPFVPDPVAWTEVPTTLRVLGRQRERWHRGLIATLWQHRDLMFNRKYGSIGLVAYPFYFFGEMLAPVVELLGYLVTALGLAIGAVDWSFAGLFLLVAVGYGLLLSIWTFVLEELTYRRYTRPGDLLRLLLYAIVENVGYRQVTVLFRLMAFWRSLRRDKSWGVMQREGWAPAQPRLTDQSSSA
jgi:cellulose synthase/poly-beta-1,6-N-acetylglucosamine synthase-like glycosyltransferase